MAYRNLGAFIRTLEARGELARIRTMVSPELEITEIADRISKQHGRALLFERVEGSPYPVLINAFGSYGRMSLALGVESLEQIADDIAAYLDFSRYSSFSGVFRSLPRFTRLLNCFPWKGWPLVGRAPCQEVIDESPDLSTLPALQCWPLDGGRFLTLPLVFTKHPEGPQNVGMYRMQILDKTTTAMHWHKHKDGSEIYEAWRKKGGRMPVAVALGGDPAITYAATAPLPPGFDELMLAGFLRRRPVGMVKCLTSSLYVPSEAEFILEGYVDTEEAPVLEGPFGDHTGYYSLEDFYPAFHVTCLTHRREAVYPATIVGRPPMEDCYMAKATERIFLPLLRLQIPQLMNLNLPLEGVFHNCAVAAVRPAFPGAALTVMYALWGMGQMRYTKLIVAVDETLDPRDVNGVLEAVLQNTDLNRDLIFSKGSLDALDHSSPTALFGTRLGIDATTKPQGQAPRHFGGYRLVSVHKNAPWDGRNAAIRALEESDAKIAVAVDGDVDVGDRSEVLWRVFNNIDASRDIALLDGRMAIDATKKMQDEGLTRPWPEDILMSPEITARVTARWKDYGL